MNRKEYAVIGLGRFGASVAKTLFLAGQSVLGIDKSEQRIQAMANYCTHAVQADATDEEVLRSLGIRNFDVVVVGIGNEIEASVLVAVLLKEMGVKQIVAKASSDVHGKVLQLIGCHRVVFPERDMGIRLARSLTDENLVDFIELTPDVSIVEFEANGKLIGEDLRSLGLRARYGVTVLAIRRGSQVMVPPPATEKIRQGDILVAIGNNKNLERVEDLTRS